MKSNRRNRNNQSNQSNSNVEDNTMKSNRRNRNNQSNQSNSNASEDPKKAAALAALAALGIDPAALGITPAPAPAAPAEKPQSTKADRTYEIPSIGADFTKTAIYAAPKSEEAAAYLAAAKDLCTDVLENLQSDIAVDVKRIAASAEKNGGSTLKDDLLRLADQWKIPAQSMRVIMQLCAPVVCCCNPESDEIARRAYGMARANSLMGSACNTLMYAKAVEKENALPFKRVAHNVTALGLDFEACTAVSECNFCDSEDDFNELVELCDMWLSKCERIAPTPAILTPAAKTRGKKAAASAEAAEAAEAKKAAAIAALAVLGIDGNALFGK